MYIYPLAFISATILLAAWLFAQRNNKSFPLLPLLFYLSVGTWAYSIISADMTMAEKFPVFIRDTILMAGIPTTFQLFSKSKLQFTAMLAFLVGVYYGFGWDIWEKSLVHNSSNSTEISAKTQTATDNTFELLIEVSNGKQASDLQAITTKFNLSTETAFRPQNGDYTDLDDYLAVNIPDTQMPNKEAIITALQNSGLVDWVEENESIKIDDPVTDLRRLPKLNKEFGVSDPELSKQWALQKLEADKLYQLIRNQKIKPVKKAKIFILDTGVDAKHEDLAENYKGYKTKYDTDKQGHGTHCAGIAAAVTNNGKGIAGLALTNDFTEITSIKVLSDFGGGTQRGIINGMIEAVDAGADIISMSLGGRSSDSKQRAYKQAVEYAEKAGATVIVAAGNSNANAKFYAPAGAPGVICVSAIDTTSTRANFSNFVQDIDMGIAAPGTLIYSTFPNNQYRALNGTSMATPFVAGLAGLLKSIKPDLTTREIYKILNQTGTKTKSGKETGKLIKPAAALEYILKKQ